MLRLADARATALANLAKVRAGVDPLNERRREAEPTLAQAIPRVLRERAMKWKDPRTHEMRQRALDRYVVPKLGSFRLSELTPKMIKDHLVQVAEKHPSLARVLREELKHTMNWAIVEGYRLDNPAGNVINGLFVGEPGGGKTRRARAIQYDRVGHAWVLVEQASRNPALTLWFQLLVLTAVRGIEARRATWAEFDLQSAVWNIPEEHMKARRPHRVPLSPAALEVLATVRRVLPRSECGHLFLSRVGKQYSTTQLAALLKNTGVAASPTGFARRSATGPRKVA